LASTSVACASTRTICSDVIFARGEFAPTTIKGRRLLAHELTHVAQQPSPLKNHETRHAHLAMEIGASSTSRTIRRQPNNDPNQSPQTVDPTGKLSPGTAQSSTASGVWRIPVHGLRGEKTAWAVVLIPNVRVPTVQDVDVDVLLHFHGYGAGYRMLKLGEKDWAGVLQPGQLRDVDLYQIE
jgi:hypothetical protein